MSTASIAAQHAVFDSMLVTRRSSLAHGMLRLMQLAALCWLKLRCVCCQSGIFLRQPLIGHQLSWKGCKPQQQGRNMCWQAREPPVNVNVNMSQAPNVAAADIPPMHSWACTAQMYTDPACWAEL